MGIYLNPGNKGFWESIRSEIYVDKTNLIACTNRFMNTEDKYVCVSRPRRFGKSMALKMLDVIYLNMQQFLIEADSNELMKYLEQELLEEIFEEYGAILTVQEVRFAARML